MASSKSLLSIDIGSNHIKFAEGSYNRSVLDIEKVGMIATPEYCIEGEHIKNPEELRNEIKAYLQRAQHKTKNAVVTINAVNALISDIDLPNANEKEITAMIQNEMIHAYHVNESSVIQYKKIGTFQNQSNVMMNKYRVAVLEADLVDEYYQLLLSLDLKPTAMDINLNAMDKLLTACPQLNNLPSNQGTYLLVDYGADKMTVSVYKNGNQMIFRHLSIGSRDIERNISDEALIAPDDVKKMKEEGFNFLSETQNNEQYFMILKPYFYHFNEELRNMIRYYLNRFESDPIARVFLTGGGSKLFGLTKYLHESLSLPVNRVKSISNITYDKLPKDVLLTHMNAFGALIRN